MTKADKLLIILIMICSIGSWIPLLRHNPLPSQVVVYVKNQEVLRQDLSQNGTYHVEGTLGTVTVEIKDRKVQVTQENSPYHICSKQGAISDASTPIVCLPNETIVKIESDDAGEDTVIQ